jgi:DNA-binding MarR family transcriptional regulator
MIGSLQSNNCNYNLSMTTTDSPRVPRGCTSFKLRQLTRRVSQHYDRVVGECGLKTTQYSLLSQLERLAPVRPSDLAAAMAMDASTLTRNLQPLVEHGWAEIRPGADRRSRLVVLTAKGRAKRADAQRAWKRAQLALNEQLGSERVAELHALLDDCLARLSAHQEETTDA